MQHYQACNVLRPPDVMLTLLKHQQEKYTTTDLLADVCGRAPIGSVVFNVLKRFWSPTIELLSSPYRPEHQEPVDTQSSTCLPASSSHQVKPGHSRQLSAGVRNSCRTHSAFHLFAFV